MLERFDAWAQALGDWGYLVFCLASLIEYVAPPFPGDTMLLLGGAWAAREERSYLLVFAALMLGSAIGIAATWGVGRLLGARVDRLPDGKLFFGITHAHVRRSQTLMREKGDWLLVVNRFLPSMRAVLFFAAGAAGMPFPKVLGLGLLSAAAWCALLMGAGVVLGNNAESIAGFLHTYQLVAMAVVAVVLLLLGGRFLLRRRRAQSGA
jgi:membrane protein DedA with SNARE-associated domain